MPLVPWILTLAGTAAPAGSSAASTGYERALERALERSQERLEKAARLWEDHSTWDKAREVRAGEFQVRTTGAYWRGAKLAEDLGEMLRRMRETFGSSWDPGRPIALYVLPTMGEYNAFGDEHGAHHSSVYGCFFAEGHPELAVAAMRSDNYFQEGIWLTHGLFHRFVEGAYPGPKPTWLVEGLASHFALQWDMGYGIRNLEAIRDGGRWIPLARLLDATIDQYGDDPDARFMELGMLITYLRWYRDDTRTVTDENGEVVSSPFIDYARALLSRRDVSAHPVHELLTADRAALEADFRAYSFPR